MVPHIHFIGWPLVPATFKYKVAQTEMRKRRALKNSLGAATVVIKPITPGPDNYAHLAMYMLKAPVAAKNAIARTTHHQIWSAAFPAGSAARLIEIFSHIAASDMLFSIGTGIEIARVVRQNINVAISSAIQCPAGTEQGSGREALAQDQVDQRQ